jgi:hypothetical protein
MYRQAKGPSGSKFPGRAFVCLQIDKSLSRRDRSRMRAAGRPYRFDDMNLTASPATTIYPGDSNPGKVSVQFGPHLRHAGGYDASRQIEKGTSDEKVSHPARRNRDVDCRPEHRHKLLRAVSHDTQLAKREYPHCNANLRRRRDSASYPKRHDVEPVRVVSRSDRHLLQPPHRRYVPRTALSGLLLASTRLVRVCIVSRQSSKDA